MLQDEADAAADLSTERISAQRSTQPHRSRKGRRVNRQQVSQSIASHQFLSAAAASSSAAAASSSLREAPSTALPPSSPPHKRSRIHRHHLTAPIDNSGDTQSSDTGDSDHGSVYGAATASLPSSPIRPRAREPRESNSQRQRRVFLEEVSEGEDGYEDDDQWLDEPSQDHSQNERWLDPEQAHQMEMDTARLNWLDGALRLETTQCACIFFNF